MNPWRWAFMGMLLLVGCREKPVQVQDPATGVSILFPGTPQANRFTEPTPFGEMDWFCKDYTPSGRMDESFVVQVGNLPLGDQGGKTVPEILDTYRRFLKSRYGNAKLEDISGSRGPGFHYAGKATSGILVEGIVILRRSRLHQAQAIVSKANDPRVSAFLESFTVAP